MKLYPIIYLNEGIRTPEEALEKGVAAVGGGGAAGSATVRYGVIDLLHVERTLNIVEKHMLSSPNSIKKLLANRAVVASIAYEFDGGDLYKINSSAGVSSFGPLAYQMVMQKIMKYGGWLASDALLKPASQRVWQKMYELSEKGVYKRKFLGEVKKMHVKLRSRIIPAELKSVKDMDEIIVDYCDSSHNMTNDGFIAYLDAYSIKPQTYGWMWAYQLEASNPKIDELYKKGEELVAQIKNITGFSDEVTNATLEGAGDVFFNRLYGSKASD